MRERTLSPQPAPRPRGSTGSPRPEAPGRPQRSLRSSSVPSAPTSFSFGKMDRVAVFRSWHLESSFRLPRARAGEGCASGRPSEHPRPPAHQERPQRPLLAQGLGVPRSRLRSLPTSGVAPAGPCTSPDPGGLLRASLPGNAQHQARLAPCRPCSDAEVLLAVCTSDFVVRGSIEDVTDEPEQREAAIHLLVSRVFRQKSRVFRPDPGGGGRWRGHVRTLLQCGVRPGQGDFLFTGQMHFGEARLGCAPRFKDFQRTYRDAEERGLNPCAVATE
ncbi:meteorin-like protein isoform X2 [Choloepus didactylus]|uniref:meteorin-like protein isoform X2 n=1 Tax=Choloepus didactylus TaxID=27675 RepID=UPI00189C7B8C|nr:meteorin-like protein isoform X2 [Choloepus didactylus]